MPLLSPDRTPKRSPEERLKELRNHDYPHTGETLLQMVRLENYFRDLQSQVVAAPAPTTETKPVVKPTQKIVDPQSQTSESAEEEVVAPSYRLENTTSFFSQAPVIYEKENGKRELALYLRSPFEGQTMTTYEVRIVPKRNGGRIRAFAESAGTSSTQRESCIRIPLTQTLGDTFAIELTIKDEVTKKAKVITLLSDRCGKVALRNRP